MGSINWGGIFILAIFGMIFIAAIVNAIKDKKNKKKAQQQ